MFLFCKLPKDMDKKKGKCYGIVRLRPTNMIIMIIEFKRLHKFKLQFNDQYLGI